MEILIKGMEMPETCDECDFHIYHSNGEYICVATPLLYPWNLANYKGGRKDWCPLVEAQDAQTEKKSLNGDVIFRQAAIDAALTFLVEYCGAAFDEDMQKMLCERLNALPSAQPEIVRCKDCKFWREHKYAKGTKRYIPFCGLNAIYTKSDDFCSKGERRTDESD